MEEKILIVRSADQQFATLMFFGAVIVLSDAELLEFSVALTEFASDKTFAYKVVLLSEKL